MQTTWLFRPILSTILIFACLCSFQCRRAPSRDIQRTAWSLAALKNVTYSGLKGYSSPVALIDGRWEGPTYVAGGASRPSVHFVGDLFRIGKITGHDTDSAVVFLAESSGGSGTFLYLAVVEKKNGKLVNTDTAPVGDRVQIRDVRIETGTIVVDVLQAGPQDAACCPGELATRRWQMKTNQLVELKIPDRTDRFSLDAIGGTTWVLGAWAFDEPAPGDPEISLVYEKGRFAGSAGCNRYFASVEAGNNPGGLRLGPSGSTRMMCPEAIMVLEQRFLKQLNGAKKIAFLAGQLSVSFELEGRQGSMRFYRKDGRN